jgi:hypothetical protein
MFGNLSYVALVVRGAVPAQRVRFLIPLSSPCVRFSRTRLSDDLLGMAYAVPG